MTSHTHDAQGCFTSGAGPSHPPGGFPSVSTASNFEEGEEDQQLLAITSQANNESVISAPLQHCCAHATLSHSICIPNNSQLHSDISDCHTHYVTCIMISIISETIPNINLSVINIVAIASETSNTGHSLLLLELLPETHHCAQTHFLHM